MQSLSAMLLSSAAIFAPVTAPQAFDFHFDHVLGTSLDIVAVATDAHVAGLAAQIVEAEITRLDAVLSGWRNDSELAALNAAPSMVVSPDLFRVIAACESWRAAAQGAFSARLGQLEAEAEASLAAAVDQASVMLDAVTRRIERPSVVTFAIDGLAKGYIIDRAIDAAKNLPGLFGLLVDIGGDLRAWGQAPTDYGWRVGVADAFNLADNAAPAAVLALKSGAVATSGRGMRDHVIFNPVTGKAADTVVMATAVAPLAADADALASAFAVMTPEDSMALADRLPGVAARVVDKGGVAHVSRDWSNLVLAQNTAPKPAAPAKAPAKAAAWPAGFTVKIGYELPPGFGGRRARYPYVAIWITNEAGDLVRALTFQADQERYMRDVYIFMRRYAGEVNWDAISKPTRSPGRYSIEWDGKDEKGAAVPQGKYIVNVESAREHGFHSMQRIELDLRTAPVSGEAPPQEDMGTITASYGKNS